MHHRIVAFVTGHMRATGDVVGEAPPAAGKLLLTLNEFTQRRKTMETYGNMIS